jgi:lipopolysaccharide/colanic/teichoic acid biosynthesis glycosyltransferase/NAD(P)-dependent dehydrogenase (short-subunit alcohol dehydrogenase family)
MKIAITGASGFIGKQLIRRFLARGHDVLAVGRDTVLLAALFPGLRGVGYGELARAARGFDMLVHCAVANTGSRLSETEIFAANVDLVETVATAAAQAGIGHVVHLSSVHALDPGNQSGYARSKRASKDVLLRHSELRSTVIYLPIVYGDAYTGNMSFLNRLPRGLSGLMVRPLSSLKAAVDIDMVADVILERSARSDARPEIILADDPLQNPWFTSVKRLIDVSLSLGILVFLGWFMLLVALAVRLQSKGPGIFAQERVGRGGEVFTCYKFRTMKLGTKQAGTHEVSAASVTGIGRVLRATKIDELPQIWNVLRNEMSFVGPRPCLPVQAELVAERRAAGIERMKPGITGLAQVHGIDMSNPKELVRWDARYGALQSILLDLKIMIATVTGGGQGDRVRQD